MHTPMLFNEWLKWAKEMIEQKNNMKNNERPVFIRPFGEKVCPHWVRYEFNNLEDFYKYYKSLILDD
jgi:hypothetical protein